MTANAIDMKSFKLPEGTPAETCAICREEDMMGGLEHRVSDTVAHRFHTDCVTPWVQQEENCPICRDKVTSVNKVPLHEDGSDHRRPSVITTNVFIGSIIGTVVGAVYIAPVARAIVPVEVAGVLGISVGVAVGAGVGGGGAAAASMGALSGVTTLITAGVCAAIKQIRRGL